MTKTHGVFSEKSSRGGHFCYLFYTEFCCYLFNTSLKQTSSCIKPPLRNANSRLGGAFILGYAHLMELPHGQHQTHLIIEAEPRDKDQQEFVYHVVPEIDYEPHFLHSACWCQPKFDTKNPDTGHEVVTHRSQMLATKFWPH